MRIKLAIAVLAALTCASPAGAVESPPTGIAPNVFATTYQGCLGPARSQLAQGNLAGLGPFGEHFTGDVNPGVHQGTPGEEEFLRSLGFTDLAALCSQFG
jgi:hypothetical protein